MTIGNKIGLAGMLVVIYVMLTHLLPDDIDTWKTYLLSFGFNISMLTWMLSGYVYDNKKTG